MFFFGFSFACLSSLPDQSCISCQLIMRSKSFYITYAGKYPCRIDWSNTFNRNKWIDINPFVSARIALSTCFKFSFRADIVLEMLASIKVMEEASSSSYSVTFSSSFLYFISNSNRVSRFGFSLLLQQRKPIFPGAFLPVGQV